MLSAQSFTYFTLDKAHLLMAYVDLDERPNLVLSEPELALLSEWYDTIESVTVKQEADGFNGNYAIWEFVDDTLTMLTDAYNALIKAKPDLEKQFRFTPTRHVYETDAGQLLGAPSTYLDMVLPTFTYARALEQRFLIADETKLQFGRVDADEIRRAYKAISDLLPPVYQHAIATDNIIRRIEAIMDPNAIFTLGT